MATYNNSYDYWDYTLITNVCMCRVFKDAKPKKLNISTYFYSFISTYLNNLHNFRFF